MQFRIVIGLTGFRQFLGSLVQKIASHAKEMARTVCMIAGLVIGEQHFHNFLKCKIMLVPPI